MQVNRIIEGDAIDTMKGMPEKSFDLVVTSPPYNLKNSTGNGLSNVFDNSKWSNAAIVEGYTEHNDNMPHADYVEWQRNCLHEMMRLIKDDGAIFYNHKWRVQSGVIQNRDDIVKDFPVRQVIIWARKGGMNFNRGYFLPTYEVIYLIAKSNFKLAEKANGFGDVWTFKQEMKNDHPAPFPLPLVERIIISSDVQLILDPFMGSGTTGLAAKKLGRDYVGIDSSLEYCEKARERIGEVEKGEYINLKQYKEELLPFGRFHHNKY